MIKIKELSYLKYWGVNNLYGWAKLQELAINNFKKIKDTSQFNEDFIKSDKEESDAGYFLEADVQYPEKSLELHNDLPFLPERMKIENVEKLVTTLHDKTEYLKQALNHGLVFKKANRVIKFDTNLASDNSSRF